MILEILEEFGADNGKIYKTNAVEKYKDNELLKLVMYAALSPRIKYHVRQIPEYVAEKNSPKIELKEAITMLGALARREITGNDASVHLKGILESLESEDAIVIERIIGRDLRCGVGKTIINDVIIDLIETTPYMGAKSFKEKSARLLFKRGKSCLSEIKADGMYSNILIAGGYVDYESRQGESTFVGDSTLTEVLGKLDDCVLNGELTFNGIVDRSTANGIIGALIDIEKKRGERTQDETDEHIKNMLIEHADDFAHLDEITYQSVKDAVSYTAWDIITHAEYEAKKSKTPRKERLRSLEKVFTVVNSPNLSVIEYKIVTSYEEAIEHFQEVLSRDLEGTILKSLDGVWKNGKPSYQIKMKLEMNFDLKIVGFKYGTEGKKYEKLITTLLVESSCGLLKTDPAGMKPALMKKITDNQDDYLGKIVEIKCCGITALKEEGWHSTLHPRFIEIREDKDTYDSLETSRAIEEAAKGLAKVVE